MTDVGVVPTKSTATLKTYSGRALMARESADDVPQVADAIQRALNSSGIRKMRSEALSGAAGSPNGMLGQITATEPATATSVFFLYYRAV